MGVIFDSALTLTPHISLTSLKANRIMGFIHRTAKDFNSMSVYKQLYCSLVRPICEYNSIIWSPFYDIHINSIESVQRRFLRTISYKFNFIGLNYSRLSSQLNLPSLKSRLTHAGIIIIFKLLHNHIDSIELVSLLRFHAPSINFRNKTMFTLPPLHRNYTYNSPMYRLMRDTNLICNDVDIFKLSLFSLKRKLSLVLN